MARIIQLFPQPTEGLFDMTSEKERVIAIPRFAVWQPQDTDGLFRYESINVGNGEAVLFFSSRELAQRYLDQTGYATWRVGFIGYDEMTSWLRRFQRQEQGAAYAVVDAEKSGKKLQIVRGFEIEALLEALIHDNASGDDIFAEPCFIAIFPREAVSPEG